MNDKRSLSSVKICRSLAGDVFNYIDEVIGRFELEADSYGVIGTSPNAFKEEYYSRLEYFELFSKKIKRKNDLMTWLWLMGITIILHLLN